MKFEGIGKFIAQKIASLFKIDKEILDYFFTTTKLGKPAEAPIPYELIPIGARMVLRGMLNTMALGYNIDWIWPYAIAQQYNPLSSSFLVRGHILTNINSTHRNWTAIGCLDSKEEGIVDVRGLITPWYDGWSLDFWVKKEDLIIAPSELKEINQALQENLPIIRSSFQQKELEVSAMVLANKVYNYDFIFEKVVLKNLSSSSQEVSLIFSIRPANPEGISLINSIEYKKEYFLVDGKLGLILFSPPDYLNMSNFEEGDVALKLKEELPASLPVRSPMQTPIKSISCKVGLASCLALYRINLNPQEEKEFTVAMPIKKCSEDEDLIREVKEQKFSHLYNQTISTWKERLKGTIKINIPDKKMQDCFYSNLSHLLSLYDGDTICPGPFTYHYFWFRDAAYQVSALDRMGLHKEAENILKNFPNRQKKDGFFYSQKGEWDSNGQALWTLVEHYLLTRDKDYLREIYPSLRKGVEWIHKKRQETKKDGDTAHYGLLPAGFSAEHLGPNDYYYFDDFWGLGGIKSAIYAAESLQEKDDAEYFKKVYQEFFDDVENSLKKVEERLNNKAIPATPYRRYDAGMIGSIAALYPVRVFSPFEERMSATLTKLKEVSFVEDAFFQHIIHSGFNVYLSLQVAQCYIYQRSAEALPIIYWVLRHATPTYTWPEGINPITRGGVIGDGHHGWATAEWLHTIRNMLFFEEDKTLVLTPVLPEEWLGVGQEIKLSNAPSYFGGVSFTLIFGENRAELALNCDFVNPPEKIELNLPRPISKIIIEGREEKIEKKRVLLPVEVKRVEIIF